MGLVKPKKFLGQHFLRDLGIANDIADTVDACPDLPVLEVGPGMGVLTQFLMKKDREVKVVGIEDYVKEGGLVLNQNVPNPAEDRTRISFLAPTAGKAVIEVFTLHYHIRSEIFRGKRVHQIVTRMNYQQRVFCQCIFFKVDYRLRFSLNTLNQH